MLKRLNTLKFDDSPSSGINKMRQSLHMKSLSKDKTGFLHQLQNFKYNPDLQFEKSKKWEDSNDLSAIPENPNRSAPVKNVGGVEKP